MMFIDDVIQLMSEKQNKAVANNDDISSLLRVANRFTLTDDFIRAGSKLGKSDVEKGADFVKLPFPVTWFELKVINRGGETIKDSLGILVHSMDDLPKEYKGSMVGIYQDVRMIFWWFRNKNDQIYAVTEALELVVSKGGYKIIGSATEQDIEPDSIVSMLLIRTLLMLNTPKYLEIRKTDYTKLNKIRVKKGNAPLKECMMVDLNKEVKRSIRTEDAMKVEGATRRLHIRRGHFKLLSSGQTRWWNACFVGDKSNGIKKTIYKK